MGGRCRPDHGYVALLGFADARRLDHLGHADRIEHVPDHRDAHIRILAEQNHQLGEPFIFPQPVSTERRLLSCTGLYDICLALTTRQKVVGNDVRAAGKDLVIITGANQGGKSTFLRSIGQAQLMMQCGMFVPADAFSANLCTGLHTHYKREEDPTMTSGKFDEELGRMTAIVDHLLPHSILLFDESFAATNEREGSEIARQIVGPAGKAGQGILCYTPCRACLRPARKSNGKRHLPAGGKGRGWQPEL